MGAVIQMKNISATLLKSLHKGQLGLKSGMLQKQMPCFNNNRPRYHQ